MAVERFPIEAGHIMTFARAVADKNPIYYDADYAKTTEPGSIIAPPTFERANVQFIPDWWLRPAIGEPWFGSGRNPTGGATPAQGNASRTLHAEQHYEYHRHPKPGDVLRSVDKPGKTWEKEGKRGGKLMFSEEITEYYDQNDQPVWTVRAIKVITEKAPE